MKPQASNAFTLVELMITISLIAVLVGLTVAGTGTLASRMRLSTCTNNLRQLDLMFKAYAAENNNRLPAGKNNDVNGSKVSWMIALQVYSGLSFPVVNQKNVFLCPSAMQTYAGHKARRTYAMNGAGTDGTVPALLVNYTQPAGVGILMDSVDNGANEGDGRSTFGQNDYESAADFRHDNCVNMLFLDGHVETIPRSEADLLRTSVLNFKR